jgi:hypothetical protein
MSLCSVALAASGTAHPRLAERPTDQRRQFPLHLSLAIRSAHSRCVHASTAPVMHYPPFAPCQKGGQLDVPSPPAIYSPR